MALQEVQKIFWVSAQEEEQETPIGTIHLPPSMPEIEDAVLKESIETNASGGGIPANVLICFFFFFAFIMPCLCIILARTLGSDDLRGPGSYKRRAIEAEEAVHKVV